MTYEELAAKYSLTPKASPEEVAQAALGVAATTALAVAVAAVSVATLAGLLRCMKALDERAA